MILRALVHQVRQVGSVIGLLAIGLWVSALAQAQTGSLVYNGATVDWLSANTLRVGVGSVNINNGGAIEVPSAGVAVAASVTAQTSISYAIASTGCPSLQTTGLDAGSAYYVYYETQDNADKGLVFTPTPPTETGIPNTAPSPDLSYYITGSGSCQSHPADDFVFLGSFLTDATATVVPFHRAGEKVLFTNPCVTNTGAINAVGVAALALNSCWPIPSSASALLLQVSAANNDSLGHAHEIDVVDANLPPGGGGGCAAAPFIAGFIAGAPGNSFGSLQFEYVTNLAGGTSLSYAVCDPFGT